MKAAGVPFDQGRHPQGALAPTAVVLHRTYGSLTRDGFAGAYSIGKNGRSGVGIGFHFLIGKNEGQVVQFYDTLTRAAHAKGANSWSIGIEFDGVNEGPLTDWQVRAGAWILACINQAHGISIDGYTTQGGRRRINGCLPHSLVPGSDHTDLVTEADFARMRALIKTPECKCPPAQRPPAPAPVDWAAVKRLAAGDILNRGLGSLPTLRKGDRGPKVALLQDALNIVSGRGLANDGSFGDATDRAVRDFQKICGLSTDGVVGDQTRWFLTSLVIKIRDGKA